MADGNVFKLVRQRKDDVALRFITTGFLVAPDGSTNRDFRDLVGQKLRYHGAFPLTADAATIVGEGVDLTVTAQSRVILEESFGTIKGLPGVPRSRELAIEGVVGGPVLVGQINGLLKIHELTPEGWTFHDVTSSTTWQKKFMDLAMKDATYLAAIAEAEQKQQRRGKKVRIVKGPPSEHPDA